MHAEYSWIVLYMYNWISAAELRKNSDSGTVLCRNLTSLSSAKESAKNELVACSSQHCASLQAATTDLLQSVTMSENAVNAFGLRVTEFCNTMQEVCPR